MKRAGIIFAAAFPLGISPLRAETPPTAVPKAVPVSPIAEPPVSGNPAENQTAGDAGNPAAMVPGGDRVTSQSGQFRVSGGISLLRGGVAMLADQAKTDLLGLTGEKDAWKVPVNIVLHGKQGDPLPPKLFALSLRMVAGVPDLKLDVHLSRGIDQERLKQHVTTALIYERALRDGKQGDEERNLQVPPWLVIGLREAVAWKQGRSDRKLYEALFKFGGLFRMEDLFALEGENYEELDGASRAAFGVSSGALVTALLEQPDGLAGFRTFLGEVAAYEGEMPVLLRKDFPELNLSETSLAKWWALQLANKGGLSNLTEALSVAETEKQLGEILRLQFRDAEGITRLRDLDAAAEVKELPEQERKFAVRPAQDGLVRLSYRCFPSYRPLLLEYQTVLALIAKGAVEKVPEMVSSLAGTRQTMIAKADRARDYLDWFEITRARETSGAFDDYMKLKQRLESRRDRRSDHVSDYLEKLDALFGRGLGERKTAAAAVPGFTNPPGTESLPDLPGNLPDTMPPPPDVLPEVQLPPQ